jgi:hypothetical protein
MVRILRITPALVLLLAILGGCASTPESSPQSDAEAKRFESAPRAAIIYLYRADTPGGSGTSTIWVDGRIVGQTLPATYFRVPVRPGRNRISAYASDQGQLEIETRQDGVYFVSMRVAGTDETAPNTLFRSVAPEVGKPEIVRCCTMLEVWRPGQWRGPL